MNSAVRRKLRRVLPTRRMVSWLAAAAVLAGTIVAQAPMANAASEVDFTDFPGTLTAAEVKTDDEGTELAIDGRTATKYLTGLSSPWLQFGLATPAVVNRYTITSANDFPGRDPKNWTLEASNNGTTFSTLDTRSGQQFAGRYLERSFSFTNSTAYRYYRLSISAGNGAGVLQLSEWQLFGPSQTLAPLSAPAGLTAKGVTADQVLLTWTKDRSQKSFDVERSTDGQNWSTPPGVVNLWDEFHDYSVSPSTSYQYRVRARGAAGVSAWQNVQATTPAITTPQSTTDPTHHLPMTLRYVNADVAIYVETTRSDADARWLYPEITRIWQYTKQHYPGIGTDRLQVLMFAANGGGTAHQRIDAIAGYQNTVEIGWWPETDTGTDPSRLDVVTHEIGHIVEGWSGNVGGSPSSALWNDCAWCDFYMYDVYRGLGLTADANRIYNMRRAQTFDFPRAGTYWFRDWFNPIWLAYGHTDVLNRYFELIRTEYPQSGQRHIQKMNYGEMVHFFSGAAGADLKLLTAHAFGWPPEYQEQLEQARRDFPGVVYPHN